MNVYVAGHRGMVGSATLEELKNAKNNIKIVGLEEAIDLRKQNDVNNLLSKLNCDAIVIAAARVGGILANSTYPYDFIYDNLMIEANLINAALTNRINKVVFLGSSCIYPKLAPQPLKEEYLLTGPLESTNEWYAIAKIAGIKMCESYNIQYGTNFISVMPTNLYGPNDNFDLEKILSGELTPVFFGSALTNFGVEPFLESFLEITPPPTPRSSNLGDIDPNSNNFSGFIFKIQANMDKNHRDRIAFLRICSGKFEKGMTVNHVQRGKKIKLSQPQQLVAQDRVMIE